MDIARLSMDTAQQNLLDQVSIAVLSKSLDRTKTDAQGLALLMASAAAPLPPEAGKNIDVMA